MLNRKRINLIIFKSIIEELDNKLASIRRQTYLAKDLLHKFDVFKKTCQSNQKWRFIKYEMDPKNLFNSYSSQRLGI